MNHGLDTITRTRDGWLAAFCECGWKGPPSPDTATAANFWGEHLLAVDACENPGCPEHGGWPEPTDEKTWPERRTP